MAYGRIVISVGNNNGLAGEEKLHYAESDAKKLAELFRQISFVKPQEIVTWLGRDPSSLLRILKTKIKQNSNNVDLIFYYAGHGDQHHLHMNGERLSLEKLKTELRKFSVKLRVLILDTCQSSGGSRNRGISIGPVFEIHTENHRAQGEVLIKAASPGEPAQESDELQGAVFSHYFFSGLRGSADTNKDYRISLQEAYLFSYDKTLLRTSATKNGTQHPGFDYQLEGTGNIILTQTQLAAGQLLFSPQKNTTYLVFTLPQLQLLAEIPSLEDTTKTISVPAGQFLVRKQKDGQIWEALVELTWGGIQHINDADFKLLSTKKTSFRGLPKHPDRWASGMGAQIVPVRYSPMMWGYGFIVYGEKQFYPWSIGVDISFIHAQLKLPRHLGDEYRIRCSLNGYYLLTSTKFSLRLGASVFAEPTWQNLLRNEHERLRRAGLPYEEKFYDTGAGANFNLGGVLHLPWSLGVWGALGGGIRLVRIRKQNKLNLSVFPDFRFSSGILMEF